MKQLERPWKVLAVTAAAIFMAFIDVTIVNVAFPSIERAFPGTSVAGLSWVLNAYNIVFAALLVPAGRLADLFGRRRVFFTGLWIFLAASALCGIAPSAEMLIAARAIQAAGAALMVPTSLALLLPEFPPERRATATALWGAVGGVAAATGPSLGGVLIEWTDWRLVFFINLVIGAAALVPARRLLVETRDPDRGAVPDPFGIVLLAASIGALSLAIVEAPDWGWGSARILTAFAAAAVLAAGFISRSVTHHHPVLELHLFKVRSFAVACFGVGVFSLGFYALLLSNILFLTGVWHYSILKAGFAVTPGPLMAALSSANAGRIADRYGSGAVAFPGGLLFAAGALVFALGLGTEPHYVTHYLPGTILTGLGVGASFAGFSSAAVAELPPARFATGSAISATCRQIGAVLGIAALIAVLGERAGLDDFQRAWWMMTGTGAVAAIAGFSLGRVRATVAPWTSKSAPSTTPSPERAPSAARS
ncbi:DHA2 family efflux MFS transporter permease subunit [Candidatus Solirubrobacter pratensis]|uniref:DHA2 family efflux MFS transporter permease subunit n=1 Tax=Candidatus Solirubrobacter pratensis TaxID=1298857 RepID=UPI000400D45A|nr:DHA2 family efflux MFS transporter permease subunit [Candidatus Solirubrobacter pratensis]